jgi:hypothetical protein
VGLRTSVIYVFTSILDGFDNLRPPAIQPESFVKFICFTNVPNLPRVHPWEYRPAYLAGKPCRSARVPKILPHLMLPADAEYSIYHDGNFQLRQDPFRVIKELLDDSGATWAAHKHPARSCIYDEAAIIIRDCPLVDKDSVNKQVAEYRESGYPEKAGLWANGFIARKHTPEVAKLNEAWWELFANGSERDQLSFPVAKSRTGMEIRTVDENIFNSHWMLFRWHAAFLSHEDNPDFWPERNGTRQRLAELARLTGTDSGIHYPVH